MEGVFCVQDIAVVKKTDGDEKKLFSCRDCRIVKDGVMEAFSAGSGIVKDDKLYVLPCASLSSEIYKDYGAIRFRLFAKIYVDMTDQIVKLQIKDKPDSVWIDYQTLVVPENGEVVIDRAASGIYRIAVLRTTDYSEMFSLEEICSTRIPLWLPAANNVIMSRLNYADFSLPDTKEGFDYGLEFYYDLDEDGSELWVGYGTTFEGDGAPCQYMLDLNHRFRGYMYDPYDNQEFATNEIVTKTLDQLVMCDTTSYNEKSLQNGDITKKIVKNGDVYADFSLTFAVGGTGVLYNKVLLKRFNPEGLIWEEIKSLDIVMTVPAESVTGTFTANLPGRYRTEAVNSVSGEKTFSNFVILVES